MANEDKELKDEINRLRLSCLSKLHQTEQIMDEWLEEEYLKHPVTFPFRLRLEIIFFKADHFVAGLWDYGGWPRGEEFDSYEALLRRNDDRNAEMKYFIYSLKPRVIRLCIATGLRIREWFAKKADRKHQHK